MDRKKEREPTFLDDIVIEPTMNVEIIKTQNRYLGNAANDSFGNNPLEAVKANIGDTYYNDTSLKMRILTRQGRKNT